MRAETSSKSSVRSQRKTLTHSCSSLEMQILSTDKTARQEVILSADHESLTESCLLSGKRPIAMDPVVKSEQGYLQW